MKGTLSKYLIYLNKKKRRQLKCVVRRRSAHSWRVQRARIILSSDGGHGGESVCRVLSLDRQVVRHWRCRFIDGGIEALKDRPKTGTKEWMDAHKRFSFVFTPTHGSWLNQVEIWFSILTSQCQKNRAFSSTRKLANAIM